MARSRVFLSFAIVCSLILAAPALAQDQEPAAPTGVSGDWTLAIETPEGVQSVALKLVQQENELTGTLDGPMGQLDLAGEIDGVELSLWASVDTANGVFDLLFSGTVEENKKIVGWLEAGGGQFSAEFTAHRVEKS